MNYYLFCPAVDSEPWMFPSQSEMQETIESILERNPSLMGSDMTIIKGNRLTIEIKTIRTVSVGGY